MENEKLAYQNGFRVSRKGKLYNLNGKDYKIDTSTGRERFYLRRDKKTRTIYLSRLQAYQKFGDKLFDFYRVRHLNSDSLDCSYDNIQLGVGSELVSADLVKLHKTERSAKLGFSVDKSGNLLLNGVEVNSKIFKNRWGYKMFSVPYKKHRMQEVFVHHLQAYQKFGEEIFSTDCVRHLDGNCVNNSWKNIAIGSFKDNSDDISYDKRLTAARKKLWYPLPLRNKIRKQYNSGKYTKSELSRMHKVGYKTIKKIVNYETLI